MPIPNNDRISVEEVARRLSYNAETGAIRWKTHRKSTEIGAEAGTVAENGYLYISLRERKLLAHRVAWALAHGEWPEGQIDHVSRNRLDNRLSNLRVANPSQNFANCRVRRHSLLGVKGVKETRSGRFMALICKDRKQRYLGTFSTPQEAHAAYMTAARQLHGAFAHDGSL